MNSVNKGDTFEKRVFDRFQDELKKDNLHVSGNKSQIFRKKGYYSRDRQTEIIMDISIETRMANAENYSVLTVIECKDYNGTVPVNDIEEFYSKVQQIAGVNVKAIFATSSALQSGALNFAKARGIGVVRFLPKNQMRWLEHFEWNGEINYEPVASSEFQSAFLKQNHVGVERDFYGFSGNEQYGNLTLMLRHYIS